MIDVVDRATRSRMMSGIRGKNTKPELIVRSFLHRAGLRFRLHAKLPGKPDLVLPKHRTVVFVHGCFWHRHEGCRFSTTPANNAAFWQEKFADNVRRDARVKQQLRELGWRVLVIWSCQLNERELDKLTTAIVESKTGE
ncbi:very short patch repair endonuclease [Flavobacterium sp. MXW15]|uniref:Very short patch repair endonuclease n=1 Tax=Xanthomonas chitinilytica TaxID=2989819 RepID=A0ABT3JX16_9XANT|nr:very short patch repair endonuclease [Xanthomonas sp. H13-6]MCW4455774.1 very short patch repair endonuclease [Flavobacterium sp. MXW15]MCW4472990.1 very short patch repair endonuclease [Xanthomonas sp. H13-6]